MLFKKKKAKEEIADVDVQKLVEESEGSKRTLAGTALLIVSILGFCMSVFHLYVAGFQAIDANVFRPAHLALGLSLTYLVTPATKKSSRKKIPWYDWVLAVLAAVPNLYIIINYEEIASRVGIVTTLDVVMGLIMIVTILEAGRRCVGPVLTGIAVFFILYAVLGKYFPGVMAHRGVSVSGLVRHMCMTLEGIFGTALGASASFIFLFCLLGALMSELRSDEVMIDLAVAVFGRQRGGPAKAAVVSSGLFGMISGSSLANVTTTGTFTIPLMKKVGYEPEFAGAVEAAASCGGQIMPPVMGATAFIMAEFLGTSYLSVCLAAALPAAMYFAAIFAAVHQKAVALGLRGLPKEELPNAWKVLKTGGYLLLPMVVIVVALLLGFSASMAGFIAIVFTVLISYVRKESRMTPKRLFRALANGAISATGVMVACAIVGFISGSFTLSGLGLKLAGIVLDLAKGNLLLTLVFAALISIILGMGVPTTANYIVMSMITVPIVAKMGVMPMAAHMFCFYYGIVSDLTPPVALGALAGAGLAKAKFLPTAINATKLGVAAFIVPFFFVYNPELLLGQTPFTMLTVVQIAFALLGIFALSCSLFGQFVCKMTAVERVLVAGAALLMILPEMLTSLVGMGILAVVFVVEKARSKKSAAVSVAE